MISNFFKNMLAIKTIFATLIFCMFVSGQSQDEIVKLPHCQHNHKSGVILVSTLDGKLSAVDGTGSLLWAIETGPGPLLTSNIHKLELTNNGQWIRIIPSLSGSLYKFDGVTIDAIPITAESLLKSSFRYSDDLVIAGGIEVRTYGVDLNSGNKLYQCSQLNCKNTTENQEQVEDILVVERTTQTIRAIEPRTGNERWNFSVGQHNIKLSQISCINSHSKFSFNLSVVMPEGLIVASQLDNNYEILWQYKFQSPIVSVWKWNGSELTAVNLFKNQQNIGNTNLPSPAIYIGMHNKQLYVHESILMQRALQTQHRADVEVIESHSVTRFPWKPIPATGDALIPLEADDSTALSVLYGSEYVNGNGFYLYTAADIDTKNELYCNNNLTINPNEAYEEYVIINSIWYWWKEVVVISITTAIVINVMYRSFENTRQTSQEVIYVERHIEVPISISDSSKSKSRTSSESSLLPFTSRYINDFDTVRCLGKGGFGVVFEVKQKIDECSYAIKRITLPNERNSRNRVMREVKALAKLDHNNIVRYFNSWVECPPAGWQQEHDKQWSFNDASHFESTTPFEPSHYKKSNSTSIVVDFQGNHLQMVPDLKSDVSSSFIVFENSKTNDSDSNKTTSLCLTKDDISISEHLRNKSFWRNPKQRPRSLDLTSTGSVSKPTLPQPVFLYIQMQLCQKESLRDWLKNNTKRNSDNILEIFKQIVSAVEYVHLQGLIHRDLKPSNIFFSLEGRVKVGDFGLVTDMQDCVASERCNMSPVRGHTKAVGTRLYMSPEQVQGQQYNYKVDIYSLGLIFFELLVPFYTEMERIDTLTNIKNKVYPDYFQEHHAKEYDLLNMMLSINPKERPTTIGIRARPPLGNKISCDSSDYHFELPKSRKLSE